MRIDTIKHKRGISPTVSHNPASKPESQYAKSLIDLPNDIISQIVKFSCYIPTTDGLFFPAGGHFIFCNNGCIYDIETFKALRLTSKKINVWANEILSHSNYFGLVFKSLQHKMPTADFLIWLDKKNIDIQLAKHNLLPNRYDNIRISVQSYTLRNALAKGKQLKLLQEFLFLKQNKDNIPQEMIEEIEKLEPKMHDIEVRFKTPNPSKEMCKRLLSDLVENKQIYLNLNYFYPDEAIKNILEERSRTTNIEDLFEGRYIYTKQGYIDKVLFDEFCSAMANKKTKTIEYIDLSYPLFAQEQINKLLNIMTDNKININKMFLGQAFDYASPEVLENFFTSLDALSEFNMRRCFLNPEQITAILNGMQKSKVNTEGFVFYNLHNIDKNLINILGIVEK